MVPDDTGEPKDVIRSIARRWLWCGNLVAAVVALVVVGGGAAAVLLAEGQASVAGDVLVEAGLAVVVGLVAIAFLRAPSRGETRRHGRSGTGFPEVREVRSRLREGAALTPAEQEVADDLAAVCRGRLRARRPLVVSGALVVVVLGVLVALHPPAPTSQSSLDPARFVVLWGSIAVTDWRRTSGVRADLSGARAPDGRAATTRAAQ